jgi:hypothetical protein
MPMQGIAAALVDGTFVVPGRSKNQAAEIDASVAWVFERKYVRLDVTEGCFGFENRTPGERVDNAFFEIAFPGLSLYNGGALFFGKFIVSDT